MVGGLLHEDLGAIVHVGLVSLAQDGVKRLPETCGAVQTWKTGREHLYVSHVTSSPAM